MHPKQKHRWVFRRRDNSIAGYLEEGFSPCAYPDLVFQDDIPKVLSATRPEYLGNLPFSEYLHVVDMTWIREM